MSANVSNQPGESAVYVYQIPLRLWHWINALAVLVLVVTGYLIASPLPSVPGEASDNFLMGYIRFTHFTAGYVLAIGFLFRIYWSIVGNALSREIFLPPVHRLGWWKGVLHEIRWYLFLTREPKTYLGHNPLATIAMHVMFVWGTVFMIVTGFALYGEGTGMGSWQYELFSAWVIPLFGQSQDVHTWHHLVMWYLVIFVIAHVYVAVREDIMSNQSVLGAMVTGWRTFRKPGKPD